MVLLCAGGLAIGEVFRQGTVRDKQVRTIATKVDMGVFGKISALSQNQIGNIYKDFITASQEPVKKSSPEDIAKCFGGQAKEDNGQSVTEIPEVTEVPTEKPETPAEVVIPEVDEEQVARDEEREKELRSDFFVFGRTEGKKAVADAGVLYDQPENYYLGKKVLIPYNWAVFVHDGNASEVWYSTETLTEDILVPRIDEDNYTSYGSVKADIR